MLKSSGITKDEVSNNPDEVLSVLEFQAKRLLPATAPPPANAPCIFIYFTPSLHSIFNIFPLFYYFFLSLLSPLLCLFKKRQLFDTTAIGKRPPPPPPAATQVPPRPPPPQTAVVPQRPPPPNQYQQPMVPDSDEEFDRQLSLVAGMDDDEVYKKQPLPEENNIALGTFSHPPFPVLLLCFVNLLCF